MHYASIFFPHMVQVTNSWSSEEFTEIGHLRRKYHLFEELLEGFKA